MKTNKINHLAIPLFLIFVNFEFPQENHTFTHRPESIFKNTPIGTYAPKIELNHEVIWPLNDDSKRQ